MFISVLELFKIGIGPSSSHTMGPMNAANDFIKCIKNENFNISNQYSINVVFKGSLAFTGEGHASHKAVVLGLNEYLIQDLVDIDIQNLVKKLWQKQSLHCGILFKANEHIKFDCINNLSQHPNGMIFNMIDKQNHIIFTKTYFSIGGGFIQTLQEINNIVAPMKMRNLSDNIYHFNSAKSMIDVCEQSNMSIANIKRHNELKIMQEKQLNDGLDLIWNFMKLSVQRGLKEDGILPGKLGIKKRAKNIHEQLLNPRSDIYFSDWLSVYAMAVNEENASGNIVVTAPTNGASGVIPAILYYFEKHKNISNKQIREFLLTASAIGGLIKYRSSISGAEVGCQGEVGSASAMGAAGLCAILGGTVRQIENAAEIALEHHLGLTCDPVGGLVQVPCIERNAFGATKAFLAASIALKENGKHFMPLDNCIEAMKQTGLEMSNKYKETSLGGLAVCITEC